MSSNISQTEMQDTQNKKNQALARILDAEARQRLERIRLVNKDQAEYLEYSLIHLASQNKLNLPIDDENFKIFIITVSKPKREIEIRREYEKAS